MAYVFAIAFIAAVGGFLYGFDGGIIIGANLFLREQFQLSDVGWAFASSSMVVGSPVKRTKPNTMVTRSHRVIRL